jgi:hypothetical protein
MVTASMVVEAIRGPSATRATMRNSALSESDIMARRTIPLLACRKQWVKTLLAFAAVESLFFIGLTSQQGRDK